MALAARNRASFRLPPEVNRILFVKNLPFKTTTEELFDLFGKYGPIRQMRLGVENDTKGTAFVVYEDIMDAHMACQHLQGFNIMGRYLVVRYHQPSKVLHPRRMTSAELGEIKARYGIQDTPR